MRFRGACPAHKSGRVAEAVHERCHHVGGAGATAGARGARRGAASTGIALEHAPSTLASSLGAEDMVLTDAILRARTRRSRSSPWTPAGCMPRRWRWSIACSERYGYAIRVYRPDADSGRPTTCDEFGLDAIYDSVELRSRCCHIRKVEPLQAGTGRKGRLGHRAATRAVGDAQQSCRNSEFDPTLCELWKFNPLADWSERRGVGIRPRFRRAVQPAARPGLPQHRLRALHARRPRRDDDLRAGRWWWEDPESKECGLHQRSG